MTDPSWVDRAPLLSGGQRIDEGDGLFKNDLELLGCFLSVCTSVAENQRIRAWDTAAQQLERIRKVTRPDQPRSAQHATILILQLVVPKIVWGAERQRCSLNDAQKWDNTIIAVLVMGRIPARNPGWLVRCMPSAWSLFCWMCM